MRFGDLNIPAKLIAVFSVLVATIAVMGGMVHFNTLSQERSVARMVVANEVLRAAGRADYGLVRQENALRGYLLSGEPYYLMRLETVHRRQFERSLSNLSGLAGDQPLLAAQVQAVRTAYADYRRTVIEPIKRLPDTVQARETASLLVRSDGVADRSIAPAEAAIGALITTARADIAIEEVVQKREAAVARWTLVTGFLVTALLTVLSGLWLSRVIVRPVVRLSEAMDQVRSGEGLDHRLPSLGADEIGRLTAAFNEMVVDLKWRDASLRRALNQLTEARDRAEAASLAKSQFLANMSHEIRTPLNGVLGMVQAIEMDDLSSRQRERVALVRTSGVALLAIVNDVLDLARIEAGKTDLDLAPFEVQPLLDEVCGVFGASAEAKGLALVVRVAPEIDGAWVGDRGRLRQILSNLVSNALKFTPEGAVLVDAQGWPGGLRLVVRDTGIGIPVDRQAELFQKFTQLDSSPTRRYGGAGLGLAICRELGALMGGIISVESAEGQGSRFQLDMPLTRADARAAA